MRSTPSSRSRKREASRARLPFLFPENLDRSCSPLRKMRLRSRAPSYDFTHVYTETRWKTHVADTHRRLLIRGVWFSFALQFNLPESHGIFRLSSHSSFASSFLSISRIDVSIAQFVKMIKSSNLCAKFFCLEFF